MSDLRDESDRRGIRVVIELKRGTIPEIVINSLYKFTPLESSFGINMLAVVDNRPVLLNLKTALTYFLDHRREVVVRRTKFELRKAEARAHILEGLLKALDHIDEVVTLIRASATPQEAKERLMASFELSDVQAQAILQAKIAPPASRRPAWGDPREVEYARPIPRPRRTEEEHDIEDLPTTKIVAPVHTSATPRACSGASSVTKDVESIRSSRTATYSCRWKGRPAVRKHPRGALRPAAQHRHRRPAPRDHDDDVVITLSATPSWASLRPRRHQGGQPAHDQPRPA